MCKKRPALRCAADAWKDLNTVRTSRNEMIERGQQPTAANEIALQKRQLDFDRIVIVQHELAQTWLQNATSEEASNTQGERNRAIVSRYKELTMWKDADQDAAPIQRQREAFEHLQAQAVAAHDLSLYFGSGRLPATNERLIAMLDWKATEGATEEAANTKLTEEELRMKEEAVAAIARGDTTTSQGKATEKVVGSKPAARAVASTERVKVDITAGSEKARMSEREQQVQQKKAQLQANLPAKPPVPVPVKPPLPKSPVVAVPKQKRSILSRLFGK